MTTSMRSSRRTMAAGLVAMGIALMPAFALADNQGGSNDTEGARVTTSPKSAAVAEKPTLHDTRSDDQDNQGQSGTDQQTMQNDQRQGESEAVYRTDD